MNFLTSVVDGTPLVKARWDLTDVLPHCVCANCGEAQLVQADDTRSIEVEVLVSASVKDRISAMDMQAKYGLGTSDEKRITDTRKILTESERKDEVRSILKLA